MKTRLSETVYQRPYSDPAECGNVVGPSVQIRIPDRGGMQKSHTEIKGGVDDV
jgi:hypothetical protein